MQVSNIRTSHGNKGFEIRVSFGKHGSWGVRCRDKCGIVACQARLRDLKRRLQYLTNEFILIETWYPEQREVSARHMLQFLFRHDKTNMEEAVRCFLTAEQSDDWDSFYSRYFRELEWIGEASSEEVQHLLGKLYLTKHYKRVLQELTGNRYLETVLFLRMLMETGIRPRDVYQMSSACLKGKKVKGFFWIGRKIIIGARTAAPLKYQKPQCVLRRHLTGCMERGLQNRLITMNICCKKHGTSHTSLYIC